MAPLTYNEHTVFYPFEFDRDEVEALLGMARNNYFQAPSGSDMEYYAEQMMNRLEKALKPE